MNTFNQPCNSCQAAWHWTKNNNKSHTCLPKHSKLGSVLAFVAECRGADSYGCIFMSGAIGKWRGETTCQSSSELADSSLWGLTPAALRSQINMSLLGLLLHGGAARRTSTSAAQRSTLLSAWHTEKFVSRAGEGNYNRPVHMQTDERSTCKMQKMLVIIYTIYIYSISIWCSSCWNSKPNVAIIFVQYVYCSLFLLLLCCSLCLLSFSCFPLQWEKLNWEIILVLTWRRTTDTHWDNVRLKVFYEWQLSALLQYSTLQ